jgi:hypothetical protein
MDEYEKDIANTAKKILKSRKGKHDVEWADVLLVHDEATRIWNQHDRAHPSEAFTDLSEACSVDAKEFKEYHNCISWLNGHGLEFVALSPSTCWRHIFTIYRAGIDETQRILFVKKIYYHDLAHPSRMYRWSHVSSWVHNRRRLVIRGETGSAGEARIGGQFKDSKSAGQVLMSFVRACHPLRPKWAAELNKVETIAKAMISGKQE